MSDDLSPRERLGAVFSGVARRWRAALDAALVDVGLSDAAWGPLVHIARSGGGLSQKELAARVGIDGSSLVRLIDILAAKGLLERRQSEEDRRFNRIFLTRHGRDAMRRIQRVLTETEGWILADFDDAAIEKLTADLERIDARVRAIGKDGEGRT